MRSSAGTLLSALLLHTGRVLGVCIFDVLYIFSSVVPDPWSATVVALTLCKGLYLFSQIVIRVVLSVGVHRIL